MLKISRYMLFCHHKRFFLNRLQPLSNFFTTSANSASTDVAPIRVIGKRTAQSSLDTVRRLSTMLQGFNSLSRAEPPPKEAED
jgi:hypothetical protein